MHSNPYIHAALASLYIVGISSLMQLLGTIDGGEDSFGTPIVALSLLVLSAATMAYLFFYKPVMLYIDGDKQGSVRFFMMTLLAFAAITVVISGALLFIA